MPRIALALALAAIFAGSMQAQESSASEVVLEGEAGQTMALPDISTFGGLFAISSTFPHHQVVGRLAKGNMITRHVIATTGCAIKIVFCSSRKRTAPRSKR